MKAVLLEKYGSTDNLIFTEYPKPEIKDDTVLIKLLFTSLNSADLDFIHGHPLVRFTGLFKPGYPILGSDCVGVMESCGKQVKGFQVGDTVWADLSNPLHYGTLAEYVSAPASSIQKLPSGISLEDAACLPCAAMVALQNFNLKRKPENGDKVLVNGAGGGIGTILVQLLKSIGADVTAVDKVEKHQMLRTIGANRTIDYNAIDYTKENIEYDYVYDLLCTKKLSRCVSVVKKNGHFIMLGGSTKNILLVLVLGPILSLIRNRKVKLGGWKANNYEDLIRLAKLYKEGTIRPVIDRVIPLEEAIDGLKALESGNVLGKIVVRN